MSYTLVTRQQALSEGLPKYYTGRPCRHGHTAERYTNGGLCIICAKAQAYRWQKLNPEKAKESCRRSERRYREANRDAYNAKQRVAVLRWQRRNPHKMSIARARRRTQQINACPLWLSSDHRRSIYDTYQQAQRLTVETSVPHHVDHIVPLRGENVCGLHVPWNLQVLPASENISKSNKLLL
jgi:hypothetical protein